MLKYFSSATPKTANTGGSKLIIDMQRTIEKFLDNRKIPYKEYSYRNLRNVLHLVWPTPHASYLIFGYIGSPYFSAPLVILYFLLFCFVALKKRVAKERFYVIIVDLIEWQSVIWPNKKDYKFRFYRIFQCSLERLLVSHIADEVVSAIDYEFVEKNYKVEKVHDLEFVDYYVSSDSNPTQTSKLNILYAGDLGRSFDVQLLVDILGKLNPEYSLLVAGYGLKESLRRQLERYENFSFLGQLETSKLDEIARKCQFGLMVYPPDYLYYNLIPTTKLSFYIANGLTVISTNLKRMTLLNCKYSFGYALEKEELLRMISDLSDKKIRVNKKLQKRIATGDMLYSILTKLELS